MIQHLQPSLIPAWNICCVLLVHGIVSHMRKPALLHVLGRVAPGCHDWKPAPGRQVCTFDELLRGRACRLGMPIRTHFFVAKRTRPSSLRYTTSGLKLVTYGRRGLVRNPWHECNISMHAVPVPQRYRGNKASPLRENSADLDGRRVGHQHVKPQVAFISLHGEPGTRICISR